MLRGILARAPQKFSTVICHLWEAVKKKIFPYCQHLLKRNVNKRSRLLRWFIARSTEDSNCFEPMASLDGVLRYKGHKNKVPTLVQRSLLSAMQFDGAVGVSAPPVRSLPGTFWCSSPVKCLNKMLQYFSSSVKSVLSGLKGKVAHRCPAV